MSILAMSVSSVPVSAEPLVPVLGAYSQVACYIILPQMCDLCAARCIGGSSGAGLGSHLQSRRMLNDTCINVLRVCRRRNST